MHVLLATYGSSGDVHPFVGIGLALRTRGHQVTMVTNEQHTELVEKCGLSCIALPNPKKLPAPSSRFPHRLYLQLLGLFARRSLKFTRRSTTLPMVEPVYDLIAQYSRHRPTVVVTHSRVLGARIAQDHLGLPTVTCYLSPASGLRSIHQPPIAPPLLTSSCNSIRKNQRAYRFADRFVFDPALAGPINRLRTELGISTCRGVLGGWQNSPDRVIGLFPEWFAPPPGDWPRTLRLTGFPMFDEASLHSLPISLERFLDAARPPVVVTAGTDAKKSKDYFRDCIQAVQEVGTRALILTKYPEQLPRPLSADFLHVPYAPFSRLLNRASALVHFAGIGSTAQALAAGIPQLLLPQKHDQHDNAARIERLEAGRVVWKARNRSSRMAQGLHELLHSTSIRDNCRRLAQRIDPPQALDRICSLIEELQPNTTQQAA